MELDYFSRLMRRSQYNTRFADPSYGSLPDPPSASGGGFRSVSAGIRPNFNAPWQGDMNFPTLSAIGDRFAAGAKRAQRKKALQSGRTGGRGSQQGNPPQSGGPQQGNPPQSGGPQQGNPPRGGSVLGGKVVRTTMFGFPTDAPDPRRDPRGQGAPTSRQKRKMANLLKNPKTGASFMEDLQASQASTASRLGSNPFTDKGLDLASVRTVSREEANAARFASVDARGELADRDTEFIVPEAQGGLRVPKRNLVDEQSQLAQREKEQQARDAAASTPVPQETVTLASGRTLSLDRTIGERPGTGSVTSENAKSYERGSDYDKETVPETQQTSSQRGTFNRKSQQWESPEPVASTPETRAQKRARLEKAVAEDRARREAALERRQQPYIDAAIDPTPEPDFLGRLRPSLPVFEAQEGSPTSARKPGRVSGAVNVAALSRQAQSRNAENM